MDKKIRDLINKLAKFHCLSQEEYTLLITERDEEAAELLRKKADAVRREYYGNDVYVRGLIEISNFCKQNCYYCGIRAGNKNCERYRLTEEEILDCCKEGYKLGIRTFVLQGGEDDYFTDEVLCDLIQQIKFNNPGCAVTLSLGERGLASFKKLYEAGADRYLLRHETADMNHYSKLHPRGSFANRVMSHSYLKRIGYQTGCGFMVGSPYQKPEHIALDLLYIGRLKPEMCGIGPFIPHHDTRFAGFEPGSVELTCYLLSIIRLICPKALLPATTALATLDPQGREKGILSGANVIMPNLSPVSARDKYELYDGKLSSGTEAAENIRKIKNSMKKIGYRVVVSRGDAKQ